MTRLWLIGGAVVLAALVAASLAVALSGQVDPLQQGTPERVVQRFLQAIEAEDYPAAYGFLSEELQEKCPMDLFVIGPMSVERSIEGSHVSLDKTTVLNGMAVVVVRVTRFRNDGPFETYEHTFDQRYVLRENTEGLWRFTSSPWPFLDECGRLLLALEFKLSPLDTRVPAAMATEELSYRQTNLER